MSKRLEHPSSEDAYDGVDTPTITAPGSRRMRRASASSGGSRNEESNTSPADETLGGGQTMDVVASDEASADEDIEDKDRDKALKKLRKDKRAERLKNWKKPDNPRLKSKSSLEPDDSLETKNTPKSKSNPAINYDLTPLSDIQDIFDDMTKNAEELGFLDVVSKLEGHEINVATMCSGTESPLMALQMICDALHRIYGKRLIIKHLFSCEIVPFKAAFIENNFHPPIIYRDIRQMGDPNNSQATTAYGGLAHIPSETDILVAGFPCVDFSGHNSRKKRLVDLGESGEVLLSMMRYAKKYRPAIIILENVEHAEWELNKAIWGNDREFVSKCMAKGHAKEWLIWDDSHQGYAGEWQIFDTKQFYIPHTRRRGYMLLIRKDLVDPHSEEDTLLAWMSMFESMKRPASTSVEAFLLENDNPYLQLAKTEMSRTRLIRNEVDWRQCKVRYYEYREANGLGHMRPLTNWVEGGTAMAPNWWWILYFLLLVERLWETIETCYVRQALVKDVDPTSKSRVWELSQNVYRDKDTNATGITGCITPTGQPFITSRGRPIIGREALGLQGLPINNLILTRETPRELQDLAGNAMTSTVVGSALISAMIAGKSILQKIIQERGSQRSQQAPPLPNVTVNNMDSTHLRERKILISASTAEIPLEIVYDLAVRSIRLCLCEGPRHMSGQKFLKCKDCGDHGCEACCGVPAHNYVPLRHRSRISPQIFQSIIKKVLPMRIDFDGLFEAHLDELVSKVKGTMDSDDWAIVRNIVDHIVKTDLRFRSAKRSQHWTITYESTFAQMDLVIDSNGARWFLYGKADPKEAGNSRARFILKDPIARMRVTGKNLLQGSWGFCMPASAQFELSIQGKGQLRPSWKSSIGIPKYKDQKVWSLLQVDYKTAPEIPLDVELCGQYQHLSSCGTACSGLHKRLPTPRAGQISDGFREISHNTLPTADLFFFLDPDLTGPAEEDRFVFSIEPRRLEYRESRKIVCRADASWRPTTVKERARIVPCDVFGQWLACEASIKPSEGPREATYFVPRGDIALDAFRQVPLDSSQTASIYDCNKSATVLLSFNVPLGEAEHPGKFQWQPGDWQQVSSVNLAEVFKHVVWMLARAQLPSGFSGQWRWIDVPQDPPDCLGCAPKRATIRWRRQHPDSARIIPFEDGKEAGRYERLVKRRPPPYIIRQRIDEDNCGVLEIGLNINSLAHRAMARLGGMPSTASPQLSWRVHMGYHPPASFAFKSLSIHACEDLGAMEYEFPNQEYSLRPEQKRSVIWMDGQEAYSSETWQEQEVEEAMAPSIGLRVEVRATKKTQVLGGILADVVGYGKTVTTLALIDRQMDTTDEEAEQPCDGYIASKATLIVVPPTLVSQWEGEIKKFLGDKYEIVIIRNQVALSALTISQIRDASIVIVNMDLLKSDSYWGKVALFAALPDGPPLGGRPFDTWHTRACNEISRNIERLKTKTSKEALSEFAEALETELATAEADQDLLREIPTRRLRGAKYEKWVGGSNIVGFDPTKGKEKVKRYTHISKAKIWDAMKSPSLEMFRFVRVVFDEHTYIQDKLLQTLGSLNAPRRWILSGTPPLANFSDVWRMAVLIGANLGIPDDAVGILHYDTIMDIRNDRSDAENFHAYSRAYTPAWHETRHCHAQRFLNKFARSNFPEGFEFPKQFLVRPHRMYPVERIVHKELQLTLEMTNFKLLRVVAKDGSADRAGRSNEVLKDSESVAEAFLRSTSYFGNRAKKAGSEEADTLDALMKPRKEDFAEALEVLVKTLRHATWLYVQCYGMWEDDDEDGDGSGDIEMADVEEHNQEHSGKHVEEHDEDRYEEQDDSDHEMDQDKDDDEKDDPKVPLRDPKQYLLDWKSKMKAFASGDQSYSTVITDLIETAKREYAPEHEDEFYRDPVSEEEVREEKKRAEEFKRAAKEKSTEKKPRVKPGSSKDEGQSEGPLAEEPLAEDLLAEEPLDEDLLAEDVLAEDHPAEEPLTEEHQPEEPFPKEPLPFKLDGFEAYKSALCVVLRQLDRDTTELFQRAGSLRFVQNANMLGTWQTETGEAPKCDACKQRFNDPNALTINMMCGHLTCPSCIGANERSDTCWVTVCDLPVLRQRLKPAKDFTGVNNDVCRYGGKLDAITDFIQSIDDDDQVLVFVQYEILLQQISKAFAASGIRHWALSENQRSKVEEWMEEFKTNTSLSKKKALILNSSNDTAAGANLVNANHIIFVAPSNSKTQYAYSSSRTQCIGRALRHGQRKTVYIYDFLALHTFDVDVYEYRETRKLVRDVSEDSETWKMVAHKTLTVEDKKKQAWGSGYSYRFGDELVED